MTAQTKVLNRGNSELDPGLVGMVIFLMTEVMFFAGLLVAQSVLWVQQTSVWPPPGQPRLPMGLSLTNTLILLASGYCLAEAFRQQRWSRILFRVSLGLGAVFLVVQGYEWFRMLRHGLSVSTGVYGGFFYAIIGSHAVHALGGLGVLIWMEFRLRKEGYEQTIQDYFVPSLFWFFVVGVWPVLFVTVYGVG
ncbi:MAG: heme-copper oxidase subunit III [bacterium]